MNRLFFITVLLSFLTLCHAADDSSELDLSSPSPRQLPADYENTGEQECESSLDEMSKDEIVGRMYTIGGFLDSPVFDILDSFGYCRLVTTLFQLSAAEIDVRVTAIKDILRSPTYKLSGLDHYWRSWVISALANTPTCQIAIIANAHQLFKGMDGHECARIIKYLSEVPVAEVDVRVAAIKVALNSTLFDSTNGFARGLLIITLSQLSADKIQDIITSTIKEVHADMTPAERLEIIERMSRPGYDLSFKGVTNLIN